MLSVALGLRLLLFLLLADDDDGSDCDCGCDGDGDAEDRRKLIGNWEPGCILKSLKMRANATTQQREALFIIFEMSRRLAKKNYTRVASSSSPFPSLFVDARASMLRLTFAP